MNIHSCAGRGVLVFRGGTTVSIHGAELQNVSEARLVVTMSYSTVNGTARTATETNFTSDVRQYRRSLYTTH